jgi:putative endonuclease
MGFIGTKINYYLLHYLLPPNRIKVEKTMAEHIELGKRGEEIASEYLKKQGYRIRETNWRFSRYEVDLIAEDKGILVIVEVKTRASDKIIEPEASVNREKQRHLISAANAYLRFKNLRLEARFDIISIIISGESHQLTHIPDAFYAMVR